MRSESGKAAKRFSRLVVALWHGRLTRRELSASPATILGDFGLPVHDAIQVSVIYDAEDVYHLLVPSNLIAGNLPPWTYPPRALKPFEAQYWSPVRLSNSVVSRAAAVMAETKIAARLTAARSLLIASGAEPRAFASDPAPMFLRNGTNEYYLVVRAPPAPGLSEQQLRVAAHAGEWCWQASGGREFITLA